MVSFDRVPFIPCILFSTSLAGVLRTWKGYTAREINQRLERKGALWMDESLDHAVRRVAQLERFRQYITENPIKLGLPPCGYDDWLAECCAKSVAAFPGCNTLGTPALTNNLQELAG